MNEDYRKLVIEVARRLGIRPRSERARDPEELEKCDSCGADTAIIHGAPRCLTCGRAFSPD